MERSGPSLRNEVITSPNVARGLNAVGDLKRTKAVHTTAMEFRRETAPR